MTHETWHGDSINGWTSLDSKLFYNGMFWDEHSFVEKDIFSVNWNCKWDWLWRKVQSEWRDGKNETFEMLLKVVGSLPGYIKCIFITSQLLFIRFATFSMEQEWRPFTNGFEPEQGRTWWNCNENEGVEISCCFFLVPHSRSPLICIHGCLRCFSSSYCDPQELRVKHAQRHIYRWNRNSCCKWE